MRSCIFCERTGAMSQEDAWPVWVNDALRELFPANAQSSVIMETTRRFRRELHGLTDIHPSKTGRVCEECNNGWMSRMESNVKPVLRPLIQGECRVLSEGDQTLLSAWAVKTSLCLQHTVPGETSFPPRTTYDWLLHNNVPPPGYRVLIGAVLPGRVRSPLRWEQSKALAVGAANRSEAADPRASNVFVTFMLAGDVTFQVVGDFRDPKRGAVLPIAPRVFRPIWPLKGAERWPDVSLPRDVFTVFSQSEATQTEGPIAIEWRKPDAATIARSRVAGT